MASMYPNQLSSETESGAERLLYAGFRDGLDNSYIVFHSVAWQSLDADRHPRDGEADFVIAHPQRGILVLEAKGGAIHFDPAARRWHSVDRTGQSHPIRDPFAQARDGKYMLLDHLKGMLGVSHRINIGHAVAFPDVVVRETWLGPDRPRQIILDATDLADLSGWVGRTLAHWRGQEAQRETAPGEDAVHALVDLLGKAWELRPAMWGDFVREQEQLIRLTEQQYMVLDVLSRQRRAAICGCAGSGKTMLAVEKARRLARQGFRVLLTCFNKNLAADLRARLGRTDNLDIEHFHGVCYDLAKDAHMLPAGPEDQSFYNQQLPEALMRALDALHIRYDAIVADEGQDFQSHWWIPLQMLLRHPDEGILYIFFDDNQRIYVRDSGFPIQQPPYLLTVNCRNTQKIHQIIMQLYDADVRPTARGPVGRPAEVIVYQERDELPSRLQALLRRLILEERIPTDEIVVLTPVSRRLSRLWRSSASDTIHLTDRWPVAPNQVYCTTIYAFKGLERPVIILAEIDYSWLPQHTEMEPLLYVACSRARNHLIALLAEKADPGLRQLLAAP